MRHRGRRTGEEVVQQAAACVAGHHPPAVIEQRRLSRQSLIAVPRSAANSANRSVHSADGFRSFRATPVSPSVAAAARECAWQRRTRPRRERE